MKIRKGDTVKMLSGKDRGRTGKVLKVDRDQGRVLVDGLNMVKKHKKAQSEKDEGGIVSIMMPVNIAKVQVVCPKCNKPTRVKIKRPDGKKKGHVKTRICAKCDSDLDKTAETAKK